MQINHSRSMILLILMLVLNLFAPNFVSATPQLTEAVATESLPTNSLYVLNHGTEAAQARVDLINRAQKSITAQYFIYADDETSLVSLALLREAARRGVKVRIIVDAFFNGIPKALRHHFLQEGIEIMEYHPFRITKLKWLTRRMHDKVLIVDEEEMITGGRNISNDYYDLPGPYAYRDRDVYVKGPVVKQAVDYFEALWTSREVKRTSFGQFTDRVIFGFKNNRRHKGTSGDVSIRNSYREKIALLDNALTYLEDSSNGFTFDSGRDWAADGVNVQSVHFISDPVGQKDRSRGTGKDIIDLINSAERLVVVESPYLVPHEDLFEALANAVKRGVEIKIVTNSAYSGDNTPVLISYYRSERRDLLKAGIQIWEYYGEQSLHGKSLVVDNKLTYIGSFNFDRLSQNYNTEVGVVVDDPEIARITQEDIEDRMKGAWRILPDGTPEGKPEDLRYPFPKSKNGVMTKVMRLLLPLYKRYL